MRTQLPYIYMYCPLHRISCQKRKVRSLHLLRRLEKWVWKILEGFGVAWCQIACRGFPNYRNYQVLSGYIPTHLLEQGSMGGVPPLFLYILDSLSFFCPYCALGSSLEHNCHIYIYLYIYREIAHCTGSTARKERQGAFICCASLKG